MQALAALANRKVTGIEGKQVSVILTGGNVDTAQRANILGVRHGRTFTSVSFRETEIDQMVETRWPGAAQFILEVITTKGYRVRTFTFE